MRRYDLGEMCGVAMGAWVGGVRVAAVVVLLGASRGAGWAQVGAATPAVQAVRERPRMAPVGVPVKGMPFVHDPSTVVRVDGRYYVFSTGPGIPFYSSPDLETWTREGSVFPAIPEDVHAAVPKNNGTDVWAPDVVRVNGQFLLYYAVSSWMSFNSAVALATNTTLDPKDPAYKWVDRGVVVRSDGVEDLNAIDPGAMVGPDGRLWLSYGSYHGSIRVMELDPKTGLPFAGEAASPVAVARGSEASALAYHDGFYYLFVNHGSCCKGKDSEYNIRVGRSRAPEGPYVDRHGEALTEAPGVLFLAAHDHRIGPGHFSRLLDYDAAPDGLAPGPERFSVHYEADLERGGRSTLDVRPLLWSEDGWPVAGDHLQAGTYQLSAVAGEDTLEIGRERPRDQAGLGADGTESAGVRVGRYLARPFQQWTITPAEAGLYRIVNAGTGEALGVDANAGGAGLIALGSDAEAAAQQWALEEMPDGSYRIRNPASGLELMTEGQGGRVGVSSPAEDDEHHWRITTP